VNFPLELNRDGTPTLSLFMPLHIIRVIDWLRWKVKTHQFFQAGDAIIEVVNARHCGKNTGAVPVKLVVSTPAQRICPM